MIYCKLLGDKLNRIFKVERIKGDLAYIKCGNIKVTVFQDKIQFCEAPISTNVRGTITLQNVSIPNELMLRHLTKIDALDTLDKYLAQAYVHKLPLVRIIHGKNSKVLKDAVHDYLSSCDFVKEYYISPYEKGSIGVTVVIFK